VAFNLTAQPFPMRMSQAFFRICCFLPKDIDLLDATYVLLNPVKDMEEGQILQVWREGGPAPALVKSGVHGLKGDAPAQAQITGLMGPTATLHCPGCFTPKADNAKAEEVRQ
jgi:hypothetical protein